MQNFLPKIYCYINEFNLAELSKISNNINLIYRNYDKQNDVNTILKLRDLNKKKEKNYLYLIILN